MEYVVLSYEYVVKRKVEDCESKCYRQTKEFIVNIPEELHGYSVVAVEADGDGFYDSGSHYWRSGGSNAVLLEDKDGRKYVGIIDSESGWAASSNAIECPSTMGTQLVYACETGSGWVVVKLKIRTLEEAKEYYGDDVEEIISFDELDEPMPLTEYLLTTIKFELENYLEEEPPIPTPDP